MDPFFYINEIFDIKKKELEEMYAFDISAAKAASAAKADKGISMLAAKILREIDTTKAVKAAKAAVIAERRRAAKEQKACDDSDIVGPNR
jgi:hypothetical protein